MNFFTVCACGYGAAYYGGGGGGGREERGEGLKSLDQQRARRDGKGRKERGEIYIERE